MICYWFPRIVFNLPRYGWDIIVYVKTSRFNKLPRFCKSASICLSWNSVIRSARVSSWCRGRFSGPVGYFEQMFGFSLDSLPLLRGISKHQKFLVNWHFTWHFIFHIVSIIPSDPWHSRTGTSQFDTDSVSIRLVRRATGSYMRCLCIVLLCLHRPANLTVPWSTRLLMLPMQTVAYEQLHSFHPLSWLKHISSHQRRYLRGYIIYQRNLDFA